MSTNPHKGPKLIRLGHVPLRPEALSLDVAAKLCPVPEKVRRWFSGFTSCGGISDSRAASSSCACLYQSLVRHSSIVLEELQTRSNEKQASRTFSVWIHVLHMISDEARAGEICFWTVEESEGSMINDPSDGDMPLRRD